MITKKLHAAVVSLDQVVTLPDETYYDILHGFTKSSNNDFKAVFQHLLSQRGLIISPPVPQLQSPSMVLLLLNPQLPKSNKFSMMPTLSTTPLQPTINGLSILTLVHASIVVEIMALIIVRNHMTKPALHRRLSFKRRGIFNPVMVTVMEDVLKVATIIRAVATMKGTNLEWQTLPVLLPVELIVLMEFGWLIVANVMPGVMPPMPTLLICMMLPFWLGPTTVSQAPIHSITIVPPTITALEFQLLL